MEQGSYAFDAALPRARAQRDVAPLLAIVAPLALLAAALVVVGPALVVQDTWLALVSGREIAQHGLPHVDHLTLLASGHRWVDQQWLAQLGLYEATRVAGTGGAVALCIVASVAAFLFLFHIAYARGASPVSILLFLPLAIAASPWGLQFRTQSLALPLFAVVLWLLVRDAPMPTLPVLVFWANVHGTAVVGVALVVVYAACRRSRPALLCAAAAPLTLLASPYALDLPGYYRTMLLDPPFGHAIKEWQRTTPSPLSAVFFALATLALALLVARRRRLRAFDVAALAVTFALGVDAMRGITWFALAALALLPALATRTPGAARLTGRAAAVSVAAGVAAILAAPVLAAARPSHAYETRFPQALLHVVGPRDVVFANEATSDWLLWRLPALDGRIAYDVRFELLTRPQIRRLLVWRALAPGWAAVPQRSTLVVDDPAHVSRLVAGGRWRPVFASPTLAAAERRP